MKRSSESRYNKSASKKREEKICNSCKSKLPENLDSGICPVCGRRN